MKPVSVQCAKFQRRCTPGIRLYTKELSLSVQCAAPYRKEIGCTPRAQNPFLRRVLCAANDRCEPSERKNAAQKPRRNRALKQMKPQHQNLRNEAHYKEIFLGKR